MTTNAMKSQGVTIEIGQGDATSTTYALETFDAIGEVVSFDGPGGEASVIDATHLGSTAKEKIIGLPDEGSFTMTVNLDPADTGQTEARTDRASQTLKWIKITLTDAGSQVLYFSAYITGFTLGGGVDDKISATITCEISGAVTWV